MMSFVLFVLCALSFAPGSDADDTVVYFAPGGCDDSDKSCVPTKAPASQEIHSFSWRNYHGGVEPLQSFDTGGNPTWLTLNGDCLLATLSGKSRILSFHKNNSGYLELVSNISSVGRNPVFIDVFESKAASRVVVAADYHGPDGSSVQHGAGVTSLLLSHSCQLTSADFYPAVGHGPDKSRQQSAHVHSVVQDSSRPGSGLFFACDLGSDRVYTFATDLRSGKLALKGNFSTEPGSGPRHMAVNRQHRLLYVLHEMGNFLTVHDIKGEVGGADWLKEIQRTPLMPKHYAGFSKAAEILLSPKQDAVFASNRGYGSNYTNTIVGFKVQSDGTLAAVSRTQAPAYPRGMQFTPNGDILLVAGQSSGSAAAMTVGHGGEITGVRTLLHAHELVTPTTVVIAVE